MTDGGQKPESSHRKKLSVEAVEGIYAKSFRDTLAQGINPGESAVRQMARDTLKNAYLFARKIHRTFLVKIHLAEEEELEQARQSHRSSLADTFTMWGVPSEVAEEMVDTQILREKK